VRRRPGLWVGSYSGHVRVTLAGEGNEVVLGVAEDALDHSRRLIRDLAARVMLRSFAAECSSGEDLDVAITAVGDVNVVGRDIALGLYRITQESIRNIARHSGTRR